MPVDTQTRLQLTQVLPTIAPREYVPRHLAPEPEVPGPAASAVAPTVVAEPASAPLEEVRPLPTLYGHTPYAQTRALLRRVVARVLP